MIKFTSQYVFKTRHVCRKNVLLTDMLKIETH